MRLRRWLIFGGCCLYAYWGINLIHANRVAWDLGTSDSVGLDWFIAFLVLILATFCIAFVAVIVGAILWHLWNWLAGR